MCAVKVDLKAFREGFYKEICKGKLEPVTRTLVRLLRWGIWTEIVVLVVPGLNDQPAEIREMARWIHGEPSPDVPLHFTRFHPAYRMQDLPPTPLATLERCVSIAREEGLRFVYIGNVPGHKDESTRCPYCQKVVFGRRGIAITFRNLESGRCRSCGRIIPGIWG